MDVVFNCSNCAQELAVDDTASGEQIQCPSCSTMLVIPPQDVNRVAELTTETTTATAPPPPPPPPPPKPEPAHRQLAVPQHKGPGEMLLKKAAVVVVETERKEKHLRTKCIKRGQCVEVGHDRFDEMVTDFLLKVGDENVVSINALSYGAMDTTGHMLPDYGVMIVYKG